REREFGRARDLGVARLGPAEADVVGDGSGENSGVLRYQRGLPTQRGRIGVAQRYAVEGDRAGAWIVEAQDQVKDRALSGPPRPNNRNLRDLTHPQSNAV